MGLHAVLRLVFVGCVGAALEIALDLTYIVAQTFGWDWGENQRPAEEARFALSYTIALLLATVPSLAGFDPLAPRRQAATRRRDGSRPHVLAIRVLPFSIGSMRLPLKLFRHVGADIELDVDGHSDRRLLRAEKWPTRHVVENIPGTQG
jgi:hypothetical protein